MNRKPFLLGHETISNHGTSSGIIPRFFNQTMDIAEIALGKKEANNKFGSFLTSNIPDFTDIYDLYNEILTKYENYKKGLKDGTYFSINDKGQYKLDRSLELDFHRKIKDFYILGRLLINNFTKSKIIDSEHFTLTDLILVNDKNFIKNRDLYLNNDPNKKFEVLIKIIEKSRNEFLTTFNQIRADIEHKNLEIPKFDINTETGEFTEPGITDSGTLMEEITFCYNSILNMIEALLVHYFGILAVEKTRIMGVFMRTDYDYTKLINRFVLLPRMEMQGHTLII